MQIKVIRTIDDQFLKKEWERLEKESNVFAQSTYHWCATWWKHLNGGRRLYVVLALDNNGCAVVIAPLCIERNFGIPVLRSFPNNFGDFYTFVQSVNDSLNEGLDLVIEHIAANHHWRWARLEKISESTQLSRHLQKYKFRRKKMTACVIANFSGIDWEAFLGSLRKKFRSEISRRLRLIDKDFQSHLNVITDWETFRHEFNSIIAVHQQRWEDDHVPSKSKAALNCMKEALKGQFLKGNMACYQLFFENVLVAYRLGFLHNGAYYAWNTSFNLDYRKYHVGVLILSYMIKLFMKSGISRINFMAGEYNWKYDWSPERKTEINYMYSSPPVGIYSYALNWYHYSCREKLRGIYHRMMAYSILRFVSRNIISLYQKFSGRR